MSENWTRLEDKAFPFIHIPGRSAKPRQRGLPIMADKGLPLAYLDDVLDMAGDYVDWLKIGISSPRIYSRDHLRKKIEICHKHDVRVFIAGDVTEMAVMQGVMDSYFKECCDLGADGVEIASAQIYIELRQKAALVRQAAATGLNVIAEIGKKGKAIWETTPTTYFSKEIKMLQDAGAYKVLIQGEGVLEDVPQILEKPLLELASRHDINDIIFQAKDNRAHAWLIMNFGPEVNMDVESNQIVVVELCRRGIRKRGLFGLIGTSAVETE